MVIIELNSVIEYLEPGSLNPRISPIVSGLSNKKLTLVLLLTIIFSPPLEMDSLTLFILISDILPNKISYV